MPTQTGNQKAKSGTAAHNVPSKTKNKRPYPKAGAKGGAKGQSTPAKPEKAEKGRKARGEWSKPYRIGKSMKKNKPRARKKKQGVGPPMKPEGRPNNSDIQFPQ